MPVKRNVVVCGLPVISLAIWFCAFHQGNGGAAEPDGVRWERETITTDGGELAVTTLHIRGIGALLQCADTVRAGFLKVGMKRENDKLCASLWCPNAKQSLSLNVTDGSVTTAAPPEDWEQLWMPTEGPDWQYMDDYNVFMSGDNIVRFKRGKVIETKLPWPEDSTVRGLWFWKEYPLGFADVKDDKSHRLVSVLLIDQQRSKIVERIALPKDNVTPFLQMVLDPYVDAALLFDRNVSWIVAVDFRKLVDQKAKPSPAPWPQHPRSQQTASPGETKGK